MLAAHDRRGPDERFTDTDLRLAEAFASRAAIAVDLSERIARDALQRVVDAQELERRRLARELHDETGQALTSILLGLKAVEEAKADRRDEAAADLRQLVVSTLQDVRRLAVADEPGHPDRIRPGDAPGGVRGLRQRLHPPARRRSFAAGQPGCRHERPRAAQAGDAEQGRR